MKKQVSTLLVVVFVLGSESVVGQGIHLGDKWKFTTGDNAKWSAADLDDSDWQELVVGKPWEEQGHADYDGFAWYRKHIKIHTKLREQDVFRSSESLVLDLGAVDDVDETWVNGQRVGGTGKFPPSYEGNWQSRRSYAVPGSVIRWDEDNVIAVRVYDGGANGGIIGSQFRLRTATLSDVIQFAWELKDRNGLYHGDNSIVFTAAIRNDSQRGFDASLHWVLEDDEGRYLSSTTANVRLAKGNSSLVRYDFKPSEPGFYKVIATLEVDAEELSFSRFVGFQPERISALLSREPDFDEFWNTTLSTLANIQPEFNIKRASDFDSETHEVYEVSMRSLDNVIVRGWYEKPKSVGVFPALLRVPGYGQNMRPTGNDSPIAYFSFNVRGHGNSQDDVPGRPQDFWTRGLDDKNGYYYQGAYADCVRAVDFLASRPDVDQKRIGITGGSQGGGLSMATAALDQRIAICVPDIPFLCDWVKYFKASHWPEMNKWIEDNPQRTWKTTLQTMSYFDTLNMADRIRCPVFMSLGVQDAVCPPATVFSVYNRLAGPKEYLAYPNAGHWVPAAQRNLRDDWIVREFANDSSK